jgi:hypothetical protein
MGETNSPSVVHVGYDGIEQNNDGFYTETTQKGGFSKLCVKIQKKLLYRFSFSCPWDTICINVNKQFCT